MGLLVDYSSARPTLADLQGANISAVGRYVGPPGWGKTITDDEYQELRSGGIAVFLVFEETSNDAAAGDGGFNAGIAYAHMATQYLPSGWPKDRPIYFAVDANVSGNFLLQAVDYIRGVSAALGPPRTGVYGEGALLQACHDAGFAQWFWQSASSSYPGNDRVLDITHIQQGFAGPLPDTDLDYAMKPDFGQYPATPIPTPQPGGDVPAPTDVVAEWVIPGTNGAEFFQLHADGGLFGYGGVDDTQLDYIASANDGARYHFSPQLTPGVFSYPGLPADARQGSRYFTSMTVLAYRGVPVPAPVDLTPILERLAVAGKALTGAP